MFAEIGQKQQKNNDFDPSYPWNLYREVYRADPRVIFHSPEARHAFRKCALGRTPSRDSPHPRPRPPLLTGPGPKGIAVAGLSLGRFLHGRSGTLEGSTVGLPPKLPPKVFAGSFHKDLRRSIFATPR